MTMRTMHAPITVKRPIREVLWKRVCALSVVSYIQVIVLICPHGECTKRKILGRVQHGRLHCPVSGPRSVPRAGHLAQFHGGQVIR